MAILFVISSNSLRKHAPIHADGRSVVSDHNTEWADPTQCVLRWPMVLLFLLLLISTKQNMTVLNPVNSKRKNEPLFGEVWLCKNGFLKTLI